MKHRVRDNLALTKDELVLNLMLISSDCFHMIHKECLKATAHQQIKLTKKVVCPDR
jgi:hypothetical protein